LGPRSPPLPRTTGPRPLPEDRQGRGGSRFSSAVHRLPATSFRVTPRGPGRAQRCGISWPDGVLLGDGGQRQAGIQKGVEDLGAGVEVLAVLLGEGVAVGCAMDQYAGVACSGGGIHDAADGEVVQVRRPRPVTGIDDDLVVHRGQPGVRLGLIHRHRDRGAVRSPAPWPWPPRTRRL